ncbi:MAG: lipase family protein [Helicobacter japonicus]|nr:lipase family protein [Helicobacter japonicus]
MNNKQQINKLRDNAELAQASYFYFDFLKDSNNIPRKIYELDSKNDKIKDEKYPRGYKEIEITLEHIVNQKYYNHEVLVNLEKGDDIFTKMKNEAKDSFNLDKLNGEFSEIQAKNFAKRYKIKFHQANTLSGFSATLFYDIQEDRFVVGFRGTELNIKTPLETSKDLATDIGLTFGKGDFQVNALKQFLLDIAPILNNVVSDKIIFVGHSLGGYLAVIAMQFCDTIDRTLDTPFNQIKFTASQVYTFNSPAIDGIGNMTTRILADLQGDNILEQILNPQKVYCVYDNGGIKLIASAQYGASNRIPIYTGKDSHSIIPLTQTLYLYSYLLDSQSNYDKVKDKDINECIEYLNTFMQVFYKFFNPLSIFINNKNLTPYKTQEKRPDSTDFLPTFIEHILYVTSLEKERESRFRC